MSPPPRSSSDPENNISINPLTLPEPLVSAPAPQILEDSSTRSIDHVSSELDSDPLAASHLTVTEDTPSEPKDRPPNTPEALPEPDGGSPAHVEALQERLKVLEQRFADVSTSFKQLKSDKTAADAVLRELTAVESITDSAGLGEYLRGLHQKDEISRDEIKKLNARLGGYDDRIEELRDTHRLESRSQSDQVESLRKQVGDMEAALNVAKKATTRAEDESDKRKVEVDRLNGEIEKARKLAKDEEEKGVKAIGLLKTVRQKLLKAEKERDEAVKEVSTHKEKAKLEREKEKSEKAKLESDIEVVRAEKEKDINGLKLHFDRELANMKDRLEKDFSARKGQFEIDAIAMKALYQKEIDQKSARVSALESSVRSLSNEKSNLFDQLQLRQAEVESSQSRLEELQNKMNELQFQLREADERISLLTEELNESRRELESRSFKPATSADESTRLRSALESKYEAKIAELNAKLAAADKDRSEIEVTLSRSLQQKALEVESLRMVAESSARVKEDVDNQISRLTGERDNFARELSDCQKHISDLEQQQEKFLELEAASKKQYHESVAGAELLERQITEIKAREAALRASNKALREELRKVQSSAAILERQRNPGVGYWARENPSDARLSSSSSSDLPSRVSSPRVGSPELPQAKDDEEINLEYLRNVILQFLEHKEMRPHLIKVLSIILRFTPQETRRLVAKV
ncbi:hypothetical protein BD410DRAFT_712431 [Rickenella mellea]|uniref:GRIP domain-containing protein n=1 Tax=Rickenella mellea TaxID=50990 RepID=A0A4Y7QM52_9AGAM|nr:hypothetical protein BD410DRAFT_712431 [Rickenella mellea]